MNEIQKLRLKEAVLSIVMDVAVFLFGVDLGFFGNECLTWTPGATDPNDIAYSIAFATGTLLLVVCYPRIRERYVFPIAYCVFFAGVLLFCFRHASSILSRSLQGIGMGVLLPWTVLLHIQRSNPGKRVQMQSILLLIFVGSFTIGYLIRLIGGQVEQTLITVAFSLLCFLGLFMSFFDDTPERVILRNWNSLACGNRENLSTSMKGDRENLSTSMTDDLYASLLQSADDSASSQVDQLVALFQEEFFLSRSQLLRRYLAILVRWLLAVLSVSIFPLQIVVQSFPHTVRYWLPKLQDALFSDLLLLALAFAALFVGFLLALRRQPLVLSLLCWFLVAACSLEFFLSSRRHPFIPIAKSLLQMAILVVFAAGVLPQSLNEATQVGTVSTRAWLPALTFLTIPILLGAVYVVDQLLAAKLKNQCCTYLLPAAFYLLLFGFRNHFVDLNDLSLYEVSRVTGLVSLVSFQPLLQQTHPHEQKGY
ncbi:hypothetical protein WA538_001092 [Blastocystis sp. DL]